MPSETRTGIRSYLFVAAAVVGAIVPLALVSWFVVWALTSYPSRNPNPGSAVVQATPIESETEPILRAPLPREVTDAEATPDESDAKTPDMPPVIGMPDPDLDKLVEKGAAHEPIQKGKVKLGPIVRKGPARKPTLVAADVDTLIDRKLAEAGIPTSPRADDAEFLRRVYVDLVGEIPTAAKARAFIADPDPDKRSKLVEELLADHRFGENFAHYWHDLLVKRDADNNRAIRTRDVFLKWMTNQFNADRPWDEVVRSMLTASGDQALAGETFFILANSDMGQPAANKIVGTAAALFLGNQLMCAECHVHPYTAEWQPQDFWGLAAFFRKTRADRPVAAKDPTTVIARITDDPATVRPKGKDANEPVADLPGGAIPIPDPRNEGKFIGAAMPRLLGENPAGKANANRKFVADWFVSPKNPFFARATVNRLWSQFFAFGFINPLDDIRPNSEATLPDVLQLLAEEMVAAKFDVKHLIRCMVATNAYQRSSRTLPKNADDRDLCSHMSMKVLSPRSLFHSLSIATSDQLRKPGENTVPPKKKGGPPTGLDFFDAREYDENLAEYTYGVPHLLRLINTELPPACDAMAIVANRLESREKSIEHLYLTTLSRFPNPTETRRALDFIGKQPDAVKGYSTLAWALLSSAEFVNNH
jgi:hypothetical protein